jgi:DNA-binding NtrC family response regulator
MINLFKPSPQPSLADKLEEKLSVYGKKNILFVDDDVNLQSIMQRVQKRMRVEIVGASTASSAKAMIQSKQFDLAILDVGILNGDGIELYRWIQDNFPKMSVIFLTGGSIDEISPKVHAIGSAPIYYKPTANTLNFLADLMRYIGAKPIT